MILSLEIDNQRLRTSIIDISETIIAQDIYFQDNYLYTLTHMNSVMVYEFKDDKFVKVQGEDVIRKCLSQTILEDNTIILSDLNKMVTILGSYMSRTQKNEVMEQPILKRSLLPHHCRKLLIFSFQH